MSSPCDPDLESDGKLDHPLLRPTLKEPIESIVGDDTPLYQVGCSFKCWLLGSNGEDTCPRTDKESAVSSRGLEGRLLIVAGDGGGIPPSTAACCALVPDEPNRGVCALRKDGCLDPLRSSRVIAVPGRLSGGYDFWTIVGDEGVLLPARTENAVPGRTPKYGLCGWEREGEESPARELGRIASCPFSRNDEYDLFIIRGIALPGLLSGNGIFI